MTSPGNNSPPQICGTNTGEHMYVDASEMCNDLGFNFGPGTSTVTRSWSIKVLKIIGQSCAKYYSKIIIS